MATITYAIDLRNAEFPLLPRHQTRTVIGARVGEAPAREDKPHLLYALNVMPTNRGYASVGMLSFTPGLIPFANDFVDIRTLFDTNKERINIAFTAQGHIYRIDPLGGSFQTLISAVTIPSFDHNKLTTADVNGISYFYYPGGSVRTYTKATNTLNTIVFTGLSLASIIGITSSSGYLIAHSTTGIAWSSTIDPTDFVPSPVTGAGGGSVAGIAGDILFIVPNSLGILIYTAGNIIAGTYTGNVQYPFKFREVANSRGGVNLDLVAYEANAESQFAYTKAGLQMVSSSIAEVIFPHVTDFLSGRTLQEWNAGTASFVTTDIPIGSSMKKKLKLVSSRYLCRVYGEEFYDYILVYDIALQKFGKIASRHVDVFEVIISPYEPAKESFGLFSSDGGVTVVDFANIPGGSGGFIALGKLQFNREKYLQLLEIEIENPDSTGLPEIDVFTLESMDGKNLTVSDVALSEVENAENFRRFVCRRTAKSHTIVIGGRFDLTTVQATFAVTGDR